MSALRLSPPPSAQGRKNHCVAVIGDGAITGGMAYEAMNHAGFLDKNMIVVLNDNQQVPSPAKTLNNDPRGVPGQEHDRRPERQPAGRPVNTPWKPLYQRLLEA